MQPVALYSCPLRVLETWIASASCAMTKPWLNNVLPRSRQSSANEPRCLPNQTPMTPSMEDMPKPQNGRVGIGGVQESGAKIDKRNSTGLGRAVRVLSAARVVGGARAGKRSKSRGHDQAEARSRYEMQKPRVWSSQRGGRNPASPLATPRNRVGGAPSSRRPTGKCQTSLN